MKKSNLGLLMALSSVALILLAIVDLRRGFLLPQNLYLLRSPFLIFSPVHLLLLAVGTGGLWKTDKQLISTSSKSRKVLLVGVFVLLILDFMLYRGVAMNRSLQGGKVGLDWLDAFGKTGTMKGIYLSLSYLLTVWHATFLSCLVGGWGLLAFPSIASSLKNRGRYSSGLLGTLFSFTQPLCSCCVAMTSPSLLKTSLPRSFAVSVLLGAPLLNLSTLVLAGSLLPWPFAALRIAGGLAVTLVLGLFVSGFVKEEPGALACDVPEVMPKKTQDASFITEWLKLSGRLMLWLLPSMVVGIIITSFVWGLWPQDFSNSWLSVALVSVLGSLLMVSTWSEIPLALQLIGHGFTGPAAAALIALPAVNLASLLLIGKSTRQWRLVFSMGVSIMAVSFSIGLCFL